MRDKPLQLIGVIFLLAACGFAVRRLWPSDKVPESSLLNTAEKSTQKNTPEHVEEDLSKSPVSSTARKKFVTPFTVERLSVEHDLTPSAEVWQELTRILLHAEDGVLVDEVKARFSLYAGSKQLSALVAAYENPVNDDTRQRIMDIFSTLQSADFPETARQILNDENRPITDHLVCASALSLARRGAEQDILSIFKRLNAAGEDPIPGGSLYPAANGLIGAMIEARNPALVILLTDAAAGRGVATTGQARMAAAAALANYHTVPVTEVLYELSKNESNEQVRKQAARSLKAIQTNE